MPPGRRQSDEQARQRRAARPLAPDAVSGATWEIYVQHKAARPEFAGCDLRVDGVAYAVDSASEIGRSAAEVEQALNRLKRRVAELGTRLDGILLAA